tara:strand:+ start:985 stop:1980 length:996 start_codon:yes stop_codon:yes gene_type:complete
MKRNSSLKILGLDTNATPDEIKKSYRRLSMKYHPDKNNGIDVDDRFRNLNNAYEYLTGKNKDEEDMFEFSPGDSEIPIEIIKMMFSMGGANGMGGPGAMGGMGGIGGMGGMGARVHTFEGGGRRRHTTTFDLNDLFGNIDDINMFPRNNMPLEKPPPIVEKISISIEDCYNGCNIPINIKRWHKMPGMNEETETIYIDIKSGIDNNEMIIIREKGHVIHDTLRGDIKIFVTINDVIPSKYTPFRRNGLDMDFKVDIPLKEALCGCSFDLKHISGQTFTLRNNKLISPGTKISLDKYGFKRDDSVGKLNLEYNIIFPTKLETSQIESLKTIL